ncbi:MAG: Uncharacterized protein Greene041679_207, partial [Parcubacteria group bacterium Greene0416_79]
MEAFLDTKFFWTILHLIGVAMGLGGALFGDFLFFAAAKNGVISRPELSALKKAGLFVWYGVLILLISGAGLFFLDSVRYLASSKFLAKMFIVGVIAINGAIFHGVHLKTLKRLVGATLRESTLFRGASAGIFASGAVSV